MKKLVKEITKIQTGLFAKPSGFGELVYLQSKHFDEYGQLHSVLYPDLPAEGISEKHLLKNGDVLFAAKGTKNFAAMFEAKNKPAAASTSFFVVRLTDSIILPEYLTWFLNQPSVLAHLKSQAIGTSIPSISKAVLEELEIPVPDIATQKLVLKIYSLKKLERSIREQVEELKEQYTQQLLLKAINS